MGADGRLLAVRDIGDMKQHEEVPRPSPEESQSSRECAPHARGGLPQTRGPRRAQRRPTARPRRTAPGRPENAEAFTAHAFSWQRVSVQMLPEMQWKLKAR